MDIEALIRDPALLEPLQLLRSKRFSDLVDQEGHQYVDLVMEGGGMLGIALVGYSWALEQAGLRFLGLGGASAGSINALLLAALGPPAQAKGDRLLQELASLDFRHFVDGDDDSRALIDAALEADPGLWRLGWRGWQVFDTLKSRLGLNPGAVFHDWIRSVLAREGLTTLAALQARLAEPPPGLWNRRQNRLLEPQEACGRLAIVAADVASESKVVFPDHAPLYFSDPMQADPSLFVRASMSIPFFFEPLRLAVPQEADAAARWLEWVGYDAEQEGGLPAHGLFVDGGVVSNFPINLFHNYSRIPSRPTFGVKLQNDERRRRIDGPLGLLGAVFDSARHGLDYDFLSNNHDYRRLVQYIPCRGVNWLDFGMDEATRAGLFREGARKAIEFLDGFDWEAYREMRSHLIFPTASASTTGQMRIG
ncbi:MAG: hypothetical protein RLZZ592_80 [Pseudomonadota bacterium]|jgi:NTE family protein